MTSRKLILPLIAATAIAGTALAQPASQGGHKFSIELTGEAEVTAAGVPNQGDLDGTGTAELTINVGQSRLCYTLEVAGIEPAAAAHVHEAPATTTGPVVIALLPPTDGDSSACVTVDKDLLKEINSKPRDYYVNIHNGPFPDGALRGQLK